MEQEYCSPPNSFGGGVLTGLVMTPDPLVTPENELMSLPQTPDPFLMTPDSVDSERDVYFVGKKHVFDVYREFGGPERAAHLLNQILTEKLYDCGVAYEINSRTSRAKTRKSPRTNREHTNGIHRLTEVRLGSSNTKMKIPFIIKETCDFIRQHIKDEGILRKSGSSSRAACIMQRFLSPETDDYFSTFDTVHDVANVLKQYLRELEVPLIPYSVQNAFLKCLEISSEVLKNECLSLCTCLLPAQNISILSYVIEFLAEVSNYCDENLMTAENLAIVMGPNIMPIDQRKHDKNKETQQNTDRQTLDQHNKIIELLIENSNSVAKVDSEIVRRLETFISLRSSEDELENDGAGKRKKRRSGSLNRMLGFLKKVTSGKGSETPIVPSTPGLDSFTHTPVIKNSSKKKSAEENLFSMYKKRNLLEGVRKNGLQFKDNDTKSELCSTPNTLAELLAYPSPAVCLDPSPMRSDWKQTPSGNRLKNFVTPSLLRKRDKNGETKTAFSAPAKGLKPRMRFGKKIKKQESPRVSEKPFLPKGSKTASTISIHNLVSSPRATLHRNPSSKIPQADKPAVPPKRTTSIGRIRAHFANHTQITTNRTTNDDNGDYVTISTTAELTDVKNEAFIASSISLTDSEYEPLNFKKGDSKVASSVTITTDESTLDHPPNIELMDVSVSTANYSESLHLTPMIQEIDKLTKTAEQLTLSTLKGKSASSLCGIRSHTLPESPTELNTTPLNVEQVETKFIKTLKEAKITKIVSETKNPSMTVNLHRRLSVQDRGISPSQRRILTSARRRSHEISRITPVVPPRFSSMRSPKVQDEAFIKSDRGLRRSPTTRCTLRRGRPNTARVGLARPSPVRSTTPRSCASIKVKSDLNSKVTENFATTPMRRMSSVQELVKKLEAEKREDKRDRAYTFPDVQDAGKPTVDASCVPNEVCEIMTRSKASSSIASDDLKQIIDVTDDSNSTRKSEEEWVAAHKFSFERKDLKGLRKNSERDSIHYLKTLRAGKVPATVEFFNKIGKPGISKSPSRSMIPRYTALHRSESSRSNINSSNPATPEVTTRSNKEVQPKTKTPTPTRRLSSIDIRQRHEQLLEHIKKERSIKRSATTAAAYHSSAINAAQTSKRSIQRNASTSVISSKLSIARDPISSPASRQLPQRSNSRRTPSSRTPKIAEEDESLTVTVQNAIDTLLGKSPCKTTPNLKHTASPLKSSNIANIQKQVLFEDVMIMPDEKLNGVMTRTRSERGTRSSTATTPKVTPKIKKALTTRAFDVKCQKGTTPTPSSAAHKCPTITPMRRYPQRSENRHLTPMKATYTPQSKCSKINN